MSRDRKQPKVSAGSRPACWSARRPTAASGRRQRAELPGGAAATRSTSPTAITTRSSGSISPQRQDRGRGRGSPSPLVAGAARRGAVRHGGLAGRDAALCRRVRASTPSACWTRRPASCSGHIPTAWYPYRVAITRTGSAAGVHLLPGFGNGPNAGNEMPKSPFLGMKGVCSVFSMCRPTPSCRAMTRTRARLQRHRGPERGPRGDGLAGDPRRARASLRRRSNTSSSSPRRTTPTTRSSTASPARITTPACCAGATTSASQGRASRRWKTRR